MSGSRVGEVTHFYDRISVAVIKLSGPLAKGDLVHFLGYGSDFTQEITSMQIEHESIEAAKKGDEVAMRVIKPTNPKPALFLVTKESKKPAPVLASQPSFDPPPASQCGWSWSCSCTRESFTAGCGLLWVPGLK